MPAGTILVADDDAAVRQLLALVLEAEGHHVETAADGRQALELLEVIPLPDLLLLDVRMPEMDGIRVLLRIKQDPRFRDLRVALITGLGGVDDIALAAGAGADFYLTKPFDLSEVRLLARHARAAAEQWQLPVPELPAAMPALAG